MRFICPAITSIITNTNHWQSPLRMFINGKQKGEISSTEGTTQGDPWPWQCMPWSSLHSSCVYMTCAKVRSKYAWYADNATGTATCQNLKDWWGKLSIIAPPVWIPSQCIQNLPIVVKEEHEEKAREIFSNTTVNITTQCKCHLGAATGSNTFTEEYVSNKVTKWVQEVNA